MHSSAWQKHKSSKAVTGLCFGVSCFYCEQEANAGKSAFRWIVQYPAGSYRNPGKRKSRYVPKGGMLCARTPRRNSFKGKP
jgi:hypothetical protein